MKIIFSESRKKQLFGTQIEKNQNKYKQIRIFFRKPNRTEPEPDRTRTEPNRTEPLVPGPWSQGPRVPGPKVPGPAKSTRAHFGGLSSNISLNLMDTQADVTRTVRISQCRFGSEWVRPRVGSVRFPPEFLLSVRFLLSSVFSAPSRFDLGRLSRLR